MTATDCFKNYPVLSETSEFTQKKLAEIRGALSDALKHSQFKNEITVIATGSYGRGEASTESDLDLFVIFDADHPMEDTIPDELKSIAAAVEKLVPKSVGDTGTFGADVAISFSEMSRNIGGAQDSNESLTRRMLFLLEGTWLYGDDRFADYQRRLLGKYVKEGSPEDQVSKFLLNDIIRYYRTIATDLEFKVHEDKKSWGLRSIKMRFSRKLLYFGGVIAVAEMVGLDREDRLAKISSLFQQPVLERIACLSDETVTPADIFRIYEGFINKVSDSDIRRKLERVARKDRHNSDEYGKLRLLSVEFSDALAEWLKTKYQPGHPIHHSLIF